MNKVDRFCDYADRVESFFESRAFKRFVIGFCLVAVLFFVIQVVGS